MATTIESVLDNCIVLLVSSFTDHHFLEQAPCTCNDKNVALQTTKMISVLSFEVRSVTGLVS